MAHKPLNMEPETLIGGLWNEDDEGGGLVATLAAGYDGVLARVRASVSEWLTVGGTVDARAEEKVQALLRLPTAERLARLIQEPEFCSGEVCGCLLERAEDAVREGGAEAEELVRLALMAAEHLDPTRTPKVLILDDMSSCWVLLAELRRDRGDVPGANLALESAELLAQGGSGDPLIMARILSNKAQLRWVEQEPELCLSELECAAFLCQAAGEYHLQGCALLYKGLALCDLDRQREAREALSAGLLLLDPERDAALADQARAAVLHLFDEPAYGRSFGPS